MKIKILSKKYLGENAERYDMRRSSGVKWKKEQLTFETLIKNIPKKSKIIDVPVGTGRFIDLYKKYQMDVSGIDMSEDMLRECAKKAEIQNYPVYLKQGSIFNIEYKDNSFDVAVCIRFLNWINTRDFELAISELCRVANEHLIIGIRNYTSLKDFALSYQGAAGIARQIIRRAYKIVNREGLVVHAKKHIFNTFKKHDLNIVRSVCIERSANGTEYYFYFLRKNNI